MIYDVDTLPDFSGEFGSGCTRSSVDSSTSAVFEAVISSVTSEQWRVSDPNR